ncbi:MAG: hypothetical protein ACP5HM_08885 [Anaerolineae bacterium]
MYPDTQRTITAARAIYAELSARNLAHEGVYVPLPLTTTLTVSSTETTLDGAIIHFVTAWDYDEPAFRREYVDGLVEALLSQPRTLIERVYLPFVLRQ